jgi:beta-xylosidase
MRKLRPLALIAATAFHADLLGADQIQPKEPWLDNRGQHIQAHGGGVIKDGDTWYWFGEDRARENDAEPNKRFVGCYSSKDLVHWIFRNKVLKLDAPEGLLPGWALERPKVYRNPTTGKYVMYFHLDGKQNPQDHGYALARVGVAVCDSIDGDYRFLRSFRPLNKESRDIGQFIDDDGSAYLIFESRPSHGFYIAKLSQDYLDVEKEIAFVKAPLEGGALVHQDGLYYVMGSHLTSWTPNPNVYAASPKLEGPWPEHKDFKNIVPLDKSTNTYGSQSTMLLKVTGAKTNSVIFMGDIWKPKAQWDSRYLWMPVQIGNGTMQLPEPHPWSVDVRTGEVLR